MEKFVGHPIVSYFWMIAESYYAANREMEIATVQGAETGRACELGRFVPSDLFALKSFSLFDACRGKVNSIPGPDELRMFLSRI
jgi:hypothetical protein